MTFTLNDLMAIFPRQLWLELSEQEQEHAWNVVTQQGYSNAAARWNGYLNTLCLNHLLPWFQYDFDRADLQPEADVSIWEFVNGTVLTFGKTRIVLIADDKSNVSEFCIPQEWVDITNWAADYYLAVQLNLEACWLRVWGYTTRMQIREQARYEATNRTYCLDVEDLIPDLNVMWVAQELCPPQKPEVQSLPSLSPSQVEPLLKKLSHSTAYSPRLSVPFSEWAAILASDKYRHSLYHRRTKNCTAKKVEPSETAMSSNLSLWFRDIFISGWQSFDTHFVPEKRELDFNSCNHSLYNDEIKIEGFKTINLGMQLWKQSVVLRIGLTQGFDEKVWIRVRLCSKNRENFLPANIDLILLTESGRALQEARSRSHDNYIQLRKFTLQEGVRFSIKVALGDVSVQESFVFAAVNG